MKDRLHKYRTQLVQLIAERDTLRQQYGRNSIRAKILDKEIHATAKQYAAARKIMLNITLAELKRDWGKRLGWDESDFD